MRTDRLTNLSLLSSAIPKPLRARLLTITDALYLQNNTELYVNIYASFIFSQRHQNFNATSILNDKGKLQQHIDELVGFVYVESLNLSIRSKNELGRKIHKMMRNLAQDNNVTIAAQSFSRDKIKDYVQHCIELYEKLSVDAERLTYLNGWELTSQERKSTPVNLDFMYVKYGRSFTDKMALSQSS
ncbi:hypothetical protein AB4509_24370, partial [Vibrio echinoideorum]